jgi:uncharacterized protein YndB with AHSA1/START domain
MTTSMQSNVSTTQVYRVFIKAAPEKVWDAIFDPEFNSKYGYATRADYELKPGGSFQVIASAEMQRVGAPELFIDGEVLEVDPPNRLVQMWHANFDRATTAEPATRLTWELKERAPGMTELTVTHELEGAPTTADIVSGVNVEAGGGWAWILSDLKSILETGSSMND